MANNRAEESMTWHFRPLRVGEKLREPIQGEFFASEAIRNPAEALVREGIQNSLDAKAQDSIRIRIFLNDDNHGAPAARVAQWFAGGWAHFHANGNGLRNPPDKTENCSFLVFEDFGTRGLEGDVTQPFEHPEKENHFFYFYRAEGRSGKSERDRGRWGIGKYVFPRSSRLSTFFGLTIRKNDGKRLLMGNAILKSHRVDGEHFSPDGYFGEKTKSDLVLPLDDSTKLDRFCAEFNLKRENEPGLSLVIPFVDSDISEAQLVEAVVGGYFYPILTGELEVAVETPERSTEINAETIVSITEGLDPAIKEEYLPRIRLAEWAAFLKECEFIKLRPSDKGVPKWRDDMISPEILPELSRRLGTGEKIAVRVPVTVREKRHSEKPSHFDFFIQQAGNESRRPIFIREGVVISDVKATRLQGIQSLVVIEHPPIATFLGDAENPAHTQWNSASSNFKNKYHYGPQMLRFVKGIVSFFVRALRATDEKVDRTALADVFWIPDDQIETPSTSVSGTKRHKGEQSAKPEVGIHRPKRFRVEKTDGGFLVRPGDSKLRTPALLDVRVAYDTRRGHPLKKYHPADFVIGQGHVKVVERRGAELLLQEDNRLQVRIRQVDFQITVQGFDRERDVFVNVKLVEETDDTQD